MAIIHRPVLVVALHFSHYKASHPIASELVHCAGRLKLVHVVLLLPMSCPLPSCAAQAHLCRPRCVVLPCLLIVLGIGGVLAQVSRFSFARLCLTCLISAEPLLALSPASLLFLCRSTAVAKPSHPAAVGPCLFAPLRLVPRRPLPCPARQYNRCDSAARPFLASCAVAIVAAGRTAMRHVPTVAAPIAAGRRVCTRT